MALKIDRHFWHDKEDDTLNFEYSTILNGRGYLVRERIDSFEHRMSCVPTEVVWNRMRRKLMEYIEQELFKE
jgi:hypothetical protein